MEAHAYSTVLMWLRSHAPWSEYSNLLGFFPVPQVSTCFEAGLVADEAVELDFSLVFEADGLQFWVGERATLHELVFGRKNEAYRLPVPRGNVTGGM